MVQLPRESQWSGHGRFLSAIVAISLRGTRGASTIGSLLNWAMTAFLWMWTEFRSEETSSNRSPPVDAHDVKGDRRLEDPRDFVRLEIGAALQRDIPVIPILINGTSIPRADRLPAELQELALRN